MPEKVIVQPHGSPAAVGPYNHAVRVGDLLFCSGQIPLDPATAELVEGDITAQTRRVFQNIQTILDDQHLTFADLVKTTVFLTDLADFPAMNEEYGRWVPAPFPARSTLQVAGLPKGARVEIEVLAQCPPSAPR